MNKDQFIKAVQAEAGGNPTVSTAKVLQLARQLNEQETATGRYYLKGLTVEQHRVATAAIASMTRRTI
jgi:hypothetical protein